MRRYTNYPRGLVQEKHESNEREREREGGMEGEGTALTRDHRCAAAAEGAVHRA